MLTLWIAASLSSSADSDSPDVEPGDEGVVTRLSGSASRSLLSMVSRMADYVSSMDWLDVEQVVDAVDKWMDV